MKFKNAFLKKIYNKNKIFLKIYKKIELIFFNFFIYNILIEFSF